MNHNHFKLRNNQQRTLSILPLFEQEPGLPEKISRGKTLRVSRLLSIIPNTNYPFLNDTTIQQTSRVSPIRRNSLSIRLEALDENVTLRKMNTGSRNYWAKLAYRQSLQDDHRQHRNV